MTEDPTCDKNRYVILSEKVQTPGKNLHLRPYFFPVNYMLRLQFHVLYRNSSVGHSVR